jgi:NitT/TauT family transport system substrate-binding protein
MSTQPRLARALAGGVLIISAALGAASGASALEKFTYALSWVPEAEHCGFFQAKATGIYEKAGLNVELYPGGPGVNGAQLLAGGKVDAAMGTALSTLNMQNSGVPGVTIASFFQKNPQTLVAHPDPALKTLADLKTRRIAVGNFSRTQFWLWLKTAYGFEDSQLRPYTYNPSAFLADKTMIQQGYITEDEFFLGKALGSPVKTFLLADYGYPDYATTVFTTEEMIKKRRAVLQTFIDASIKGWVECLRGNPMPAYELIQKMMPEQSIELSKFKVDQMRKGGFIDGGDAAKLGIGAMTDARWQAIYEVMSKGGAYPQGMDYKKAYTLEFINKKGGL